MTYIKDNIPNDDLTNDIQSKIFAAQHDGKLYSSYIKEQQNAMILEERGRAKTIKQLLKNGLPAEKIISLLEMSSDEVKFYFGNIQPV